MWQFTTCGFFSIVQKTGDDCLTVRTRTNGDLDRLRRKYMPGLSPTIAHGGTDYPFRARISRDEFASALAVMASDITYPNFKDEVARSCGLQRASVYHRIWNDLLMLENGDDRT